MSRAPLLAVLIPFLALVPVASPADQPGSAVAIPGAEVLVVPICQATEQKAAQDVRFVDWCDEVGCNNPCDICRHYPSHSCCLGCSTEGNCHGGPDLRNAKPAMADGVPGPGSETSAETSIGVEESSVEISVTDGADS